MSVVLFTTLIHIKNSKGKTMVYQRSNKYAMNRATLTDELRELRKATGHALIKDLCEILNGDRDTITNTAKDPTASNIRLICAQVVRHALMGKLVYIQEVHRVLGLNTEIQVGNVDGEEFVSKVLYLPPRRVEEEK